MDQVAISNYISVTKIFRFEMAHFLHKHNGLCQNLHGHSYKLLVTLAGRVKHEPNTPDDGMLMDFGELKKLVKDEILDHFDHALVVNENSPEATKLEALGFDRTVLLPFQPTCENLILHFVRKLVPHIPPGVKLQRLRLYETETSYADWHA